MDKNEEKFEAGLAVLEMARTAGWKWLEGKIKQELSMEYDELREFELAGKTAEEIASEYLQHRANANAYEKILSMVDTAIREKDEAADIISRG
ncbi:MAG: hypothetical protein WC238_00465 [Parcubacteria group bacterium]|jgi:uncharacterized protein YukE